MRSERTNDFSLWVDGYIGFRGISCGGTCTCVSAEGQGIHYLSGLMVRVAARNFHGIFSARVYF